jgi:BASS family bile acid:Na+ symporter
MRFLNAMNAFIEKWMPLVTPLCLVVGVLFPEQLSHLLFLVPYVFAFMTFCGSLGSQFRDVKQVFRHPLPLAAMFLIIHFVMPLLAFLAGGLLFPQHPYFVTGMVLEFVVPSAVVSLMWVSIYRGSVPFTLSVVLIDTLLAPFLVPLSLRWFVGSNVQMDSWGMMKGLLLMVAVPAVAAISLNQATKGKMKRTFAPKLAPFSKLALMFVVCVNSSKVSSFIRNMTPMLFAVAGAILLIAITGYCLGWIGALLLKQNRDMIVSMTFSSGMKNISAGAVIAAAYFPAEVMFPVMIGTLFQQILAAAFAQLITRRYGTGKDAG